MADKTLSATKGTETGKGTQFMGDPDTWVCLCKAWNKEEGWMKSTKAMKLGDEGCLVQVSTQQGDHVAEAVTFIPGVEFRVDCIDGELKSVVWSSLERGV